MSNQRVNYRWLVSVVFALTMGPVTAATQELGPAFQINTYTTGDQTEPLVRRLADGSFIVMWTGERLVARRFDADGNATSDEVSLVDGGTPRPFSPAIFAAANGGFVVAWHARPEGGGDYDVVVRRFNGDFTPHGPAEPVSGRMSELRAMPAGAISRFGGLIAWEGGGDGDDAGVFARRTDSVGELLGTEFRINEVTFGTQSAPDVASSDAGHFVIVWRSAPTPFHTGEGIVGLRLDRKGSRVGTEFRVSGPGRDAGGALALQMNPQVAVNDAGEFVVAWRKEGSFNGYYYYNHGYTVDYRVPVRHFDAGADLVSEDSAAASQVLDVDSDAAGNFVVAGVARYYPYEYRDDSYDYPDQLRVTKVSADGSVERLPTVAQSAGYDYDAYSSIEGSVAAGAPGHFIVVWSDQHGYGDAAELMGRTTGSPVAPAACGEATRAFSAARSTAGVLVASDAFAILLAVVGLRDCDACICDVDGTGTIDARDALTALRDALGFVVDLRCPACA